MTAKYLLDSDICILALSGKYAGSLMNLIRDIQPEGLALSVIVYGEVLEGALYSRQRALNVQRWQEFAEGCDILSVTLPIAEVWADIRGRLRGEGRTTPDNDLIIAATALTFDMTLVTGNEKHHGRVEGLKMLVPERQSTSS